MEIREGRLLTRVGLKGKRFRIFEDALIDTGAAFTVIVEKDEDGYYVGSVVELPGCHTQAKSLDELTERIKEAVELYLETEGAKEAAEFVGIQRVKIVTR